METKIIANNGGNSYNNYVTLIKEWAKKNFFFHHGVVSYHSQDGELPKVSPLPKELDNDKMIYETNRFDTAFSHLIYTILITGEMKEFTEAEARLKELCDSFK
jgi:hypothetical protein